MPYNKRDDWLEVIMATMPLVKNLYLPSRLQERVGGIKSAKYVKPCAIVKHGCKQQRWRVRNDDNC